GRGPRRVLAGWPADAKTASFAVPAGVLVYPQYAHLEHVEPRHTRQLRTGTDGYFGKVGRWLRGASDDRLSTKRLSPAPAAVDRGEPTRALIERQPWHSI